MTHKRGYTRSPARGLNPPARYSGFTLLEIMVVIVIIGVMVTFAQLSIGNRALDDTLENEAKRTIAIIQLAAEEAEAKGQDLGLRFSQTGFQLLSINRQRRWAPYQKDGVFRPRNFGGPVSAQLLVENRPVSLSSAEQEAEAQAREAEALDTQGKASSANAPAKQVLQPQIVLLSSGEITPFELVLTAPGLKQGYQITANALGKLSQTRQPSPLP